MGDEVANHEGGINTSYFRNYEVFILPWSCVRWKGIRVCSNRVFAVFDITNVRFSGKAVAKLVELAHSACVLSECCLL